MKEYKIIYRPYLLTPLLDQQFDSIKGGEVSDLNDVLNNQSKEDWTVKNGGIIEDTGMAERVIICVLMEKDAGDTHQLR